MLENRRGNWKSIGAVSDEFRVVIFDVPFERVGPPSVYVETLNLF